MRSYKLTYFNGKGRAEICRLMFAMSGTKFEDVRVESEEWNKMKSSTPFGTLPILEVDGKILTDSGAIARYLARELGLNGKTAMEAARIDMIMGICTDVANPLVKIMFEKDEEAKKKMVADFIKDNLPKFNAFVGKELGSNDWLVGNSPSLADAMVAQTVGGFLTGVLGESNARGCEKVDALVKRFEALPNVARYIASRPATPF